MRLRGDFEVLCHSCRATVRLLAIACLLLHSIGLRAGSQVRFTELYTVGAEDFPEEQVFDEQTTIALTSRGTLYVAEKRLGRIKVFDSTGNFVRQFGNKGKGPGEFQYITSIALTPASDSLYVFDHKLRRVSVFSATGRLVRDFRPALEWDGVLQMERHSTGALLFVGHVSGHRGMVHVLDATGAYVRSLADLLEIDDPHYDDPFLRNQLEQGMVCELSGGDLLVALRAPYVVARFSLDGRKRWQVHDDILPKPWKKHIVFAPRSYKVGVYPSVTGLDDLGGGLFQVITTDIEHERRSSDLRRAADGTLVSRRRLGFDSHPGLSCPREASGSLGVVYVGDPYPRFIVSRWTVTSR